MKNLAKSLVLLPVALLSLTACEKQISEEERLNRLNSYSLADAKAKYDFVLIEAKSKAEKRTGEFKEGGMFYDFYTFEDSIEMAYEFDSFVLSEDMINRTTMLNDEDETLPKVEYYSYKNTGLKVVATKSQKYTSDEGLTFDISTKIVAYTFDDGRIEKEEGTAKAKVSGTIGGKKVSGSISGTETAKITWNRK